MAYDSLREVTGTLIMDWRAYLTQLKHQLTQAHQRALVVIAGNNEFQQQAFVEINTLYPSLITLSTRLQNGIWPEHIHQLLGQEHEAVVFDVHSGLTPNKLAAISGTVKAGGALFLFTPALCELADYCDPGYQQYLSVECDALNYSVFNKRLSKLLPSLNCAILEQKAIIKKVAIDKSPPPSLSEQASAVALATKQLSKNKHTFLLTSHRGRGKSAALGMVAAELVSSGKSVVICAMQETAVTNVFKHAEQTLANRNHLALTSNIHFVPPDVLLAEEYKNTVVLVDEAASIPLPTLNKLLNTFPRIGFASTVHGYEGSGRGFSLKFIPYLKQHTKNCLHAQLSSPIRYAENDPLEVAVDKLLLLDTDFKPVMASGNIEFKQVTQTTLLQDEALLRQLFSLLVCAHYQTSPNDLRHLLDGNNLSLYIAQQGETVIGAVLLSKEGHLSDELSQAIVAGKRRPKGHLLAQSIAQLALNPALLKLRYARVVRIAIHPEFHNNGIGSKLLTFVEENAHYDAIGASFACNSQLISFWHKNNYRTVSIGFKRDKASGEHAALVLKSSHLALNNEALNSKFYRLFVAQLNRCFQDLDPALVLKLLGETALIDAHNNLSKFELAQLSAFANGALQLESCFASLYKSLLLFAINLDKLELVYVNLLIRLILQNKYEAEVMAEFKLSGKRELSRLVQQAAAAWVDIINCEKATFILTNNGGSDHCE